MKRALVTGANRGIGFAIAKGLVDKGIEVILGARDYNSGQKSASQIGATALELDVANYCNFEHITNALGPIDILINNAGVLGTGGVLDDPAEFKTSMDVMVNGPYHLMRLLIPHMIENDYGRIVNVSSGWGSFSEGLDGPGGYSVAKAALNALTVSAARSLPENIKVNAMCPGWVRTRMGGMDATRLPEEAADTALWLATLPKSGPKGGFYRDREEISW